MVHPDSSRVPRVPPYSGTYLPSLSISHTGLSPSMAELPSSVLLSTQIGVIVRPTTPQKPKFLRFWAIPTSLTATMGISIDFSSSGYLDVSVPLVSHPYGLTTEVAGFPHSEISGSKLD